MKSTLNKLAFTILALTILWSCGKDDGPQEFDNFAPVIYDQALNLSGVLTGGQEVGLVKAYDSNMGTELKYTITTNHNDLFQINEATGLLSIKADKELDLNESPSQKIMVSITDGEEADDAQILICDCTPRFAQESYSFEVSEVISSVVIIHTFEVTDVDTEAEDLVFDIPTNDNGLFEINEFGELSLASDESLDYETAAEHNITVSVTDGTETTEVDVFIKVINEIETLAEDPNSFITTWQTDVDGETIYIGLNNEYNYDFTIDWGDGTVQDINLANPYYISHVYETAGQHTVTIIGDFPAILVYSIDLNNLQPEPAPKEGYGLVGIEQWGDIQWQTMEYAFAYASSLEFYNTTDVPNLSQVTSIRGMFSNASAFNGDLSNWNTSSVTNMHAVFNSASAFNSDLSNWDTSKVTDMGWMFADAITFNADISSWETGLVGDMTLLFLNAAAFDQNLGEWNINSATSMAWMLQNSGMSNNNYGLTLQGWAQDVGIPSNITLGATGLQINCAAPGFVNARDYLIDTKNWEIIDTPCP